MIFNPRYVPSYQGEDQLVKSNFYAEVKQQVLHSLGISSVLFEKYHQQNTNLRHSEYKCLLTKNGKKHAYLITPNAHKYAKEVLQLGDTISGDSSSCKSGIEFELNKAGDSLGSYLIGDTFNNEIMASYITASSQLTKATLSVLDDTGNYKITYDGAPEKPTKNPSYPTNPTRERPESSSGNHPISESTPTPKPVNPVEPTGGNVNHDKPQKKYVRSSRCNYEKYKKGIVADELDIPYTSNLYPTGIYFTFYMGHVETSDEINECKSVGQQIYFRGIPVTCDKDSILTTEKRIAYGMTLTRVRKFISGLLKQYSPPGSVFYKNIEGDTNYKGELRYLNGDMIINIHLRAFPPGDDSYAFGVATVRDKLYKRTLGGELFINTRRIPNKYENYNTGNNSFFYGIVHQVFHIFGVDKDLFNEYHLWNNPIRHSNPICTLTKNGRKYHFLTTPASNEWAKKHFGTDEFYGDNGQKCKAGIEFDDHGGIMDSHLAGNSYFSELMTEEMLVPDGLRFARLTAASLAILNDTGNFMADWKKAQPLVWGDMESIDSNLIDDFATKDPQQYPEYYNADVPVSNDKFYAGFNFKYFGSTSTMQTPYCPNPDVRYCDKPEFYNKQGKSVIGSSESFGYIPFVNPNYTCPSSKATLPTTEPNENTLCGEYNCESYQKFTIKVNKDTSGKDWEEVTCTSSNINQVFNIHINGKIQRKVKCVNPERFCRSVILSEMMLRKNPMDKNSWQLSDIGPKQFDSNVRKSIRKDIKTNEDEALNEQRWGNVEAWFRKNKIGFAIGCGIFVVAIIIVVVGILAYKRLHPKEENNEDNENKEMSSEYSDQTPVA